MKVRNGCVSVLVAVCLLVGVACAGVSRVPVVPASQHDNKVAIRGLVQTTVSDPHAFAPTTQRSWLEVCDYRVDRGEDENVVQFPDYIYENCTRDGAVQFTTTNGYLDGLGSAALYSGAIVGGAYFIGKGLGDSGSNVSQSGGGSSQTQQQGQIQGQQQGIIQHGGSKH